MRRRNKIIIIILAVLAIAGSGFIIWAETPLGPMSEALDALKTDANVRVTSGEWLVFQPNNSTPHTGFIIYPGGRVDYRSYAPEAHTIAANNFLVIIVKMPLNLAVFDPNAAQKVIDSYPMITSWAVGGHSLGGTMAAQYASNPPQSLNGLVLWASYPASGNDLSKTQLKVLTIHGTLDGLVSSTQIDDSMKMLPHDAIRVEIQGGDHAQFGWYGSQPGDNEATSTREEQQKETVQATTELLTKIS
jgi:dienelactone hydrolase